MCNVHMNTRFPGRMLPCNGIIKLFTAPVSGFNVMADRLYDGSSSRSRNSYILVKVMACYSRSAGLPEGANGIFMKPGYFCLQEQLILKSV